MFKQILNKIFPRRKGNKRGVSPVIATILLIALTVTAAAIVYFVVVPLLQTKGEIVQMSGVSLSDTDIDGSYDKATVELYNVGTEVITLDENAVLTLYTPTTNTTFWLILSNREISTQESKVITISAISDIYEIPPLAEYEFILSYDGNSFATGRQTSSYGSSGESGPEPPPSQNFTGRALTLRTASDDSSSTRGTFPTTSGYSPTLWFLVGIFRSGTRNLDGDFTDYIASNGFGAAEDYRPYIGCSDTFSTYISAHTGYESLAYTDAGQYPGLVQFAGNTYDNADTLNWPARGIVYMFTYIYNPTPSSMDVDLSIQSDDAYNIWVNGEHQGSGTRRDRLIWCSPITITLNPGYNIVTVRSADRGTDWDAQILLWDTGVTNDLSTLLNVWPLIPPTSIFW